MSKRLSKEQRGYDEFILSSAASLGTKEFWVIRHPDGKFLEDTASKDVSFPVRVLCGALNLDWDEAVDQGFSLERYTQS